MNDNIPACVLDSFALLAYLGGEVGTRRVKALLIDADQNRCSVYLPIINLGEVLYITERERGLPKAQAVLARVEGLPVEILPATRDAVLEAAHIKAQYPISYADAFAVAAAQTLGSRILTGDMEFEAVEELVEVEWLSGGD